MHGEKLYTQRTGISTHRRSCTRFSPGEFSQTANARTIFGAGTTRPSHRQLAPQPLARAVTSSAPGLHRPRCPANVFTQLFGLGLPVPRLITRCSNRRVPPTRLVARSEQQQQQQPSPSKYNIVIPPSLCVLPISKPSALGAALRFLLLAASYSTPPQTCFFVYLFSSSFFFFILHRLLPYLQRPCRAGTVDFLCFCCGAHSYSLLSRTSIPVGDRDRIVRPRHALLPRSLQHRHGTSFPPWRRTRTATRSMRRGPPRSAPSAPAPARELSVQP